MSGKRQYPTAISQQVAQFYQDVIDHVMSMEDAATGELVSGPFTKLPPRKLYPDYYDIVKDPISIAEIRSRSINTKRKPRTEMCSLARFGELWDLMVANSKLYNAEDSLIVQFAERINAYVQGEIARFAKAHEANLALEGGEAMELAGQPVSKKAKIENHAGGAPALGAMGISSDEVQYVDHFEYPFGEADYEDLKKKGNEELPRILKHLLSYKMSHHKNSQPLSRPFVRLPPKTDTAPPAAPGTVSMDPKIYYDTVETPMSFNIIQGRLRNGVYSAGQLGVDRFHYDVELVISNALAIYSEGTAIWKCATGLQRALDKRWDRFLGNDEHDVREGPDAEEEGEEDERYEEEDDGEYEEETGLAEQMVDVKPEVREETPEEDMRSQFVRKHEEPTQYALTSITLKSIELNTATLSTGTEDPTAFFSTTVLDPNEKQFTIQLPSEAVINREIVLELRLMGAIASEKFQLECTVNGEKVPGRIPNEYHIENGGSFVARTMLMRIGYGLNLLRWDLTLENGALESSKLWINVTN